MSLNASTKSVYNVQSRIALNITRTEHFSLQKQGAG